MDVFSKIPIPSDRTAFVKLSWLACQCREHGAQLVSIAGWVMPTLPQPWDPQTARLLRRFIYDTEQCRCTLQAHHGLFPVMTQAEAQSWQQQHVRHHGVGAWPSWWSASVVALGELIINVAQAKEE